MNTAFDAHDVMYTYAGARTTAVAALSFRIERGSFCAILGPNGSGKSTLTRLLLGVLSPDSGTIRYDGRALTSWERTDLARRVGVVAQGEEIAFPMRVREFVGMGRYPHLGPWRRARAVDDEAIEKALRHCEVDELAARSMATLSGGERQRARLARALAQEPETLVLDEPTASLDVAHEMAIFELLAGLATNGVTVIAVTHNLNLAARYAGHLMLLDRGRMGAHGAPHDVLERSTIERIYGWQLRVYRHEGPGPDTGAPQVVPLSDQLRKGTPP